MKADEFLGILLSEYCYILVYYILKLASDHPSRFGQFFFFSKLILNKIYLFKYSCYLNKRFNNSHDLVTAKCYF